MWIKDRHHFLKYIRLIKEKFERNPHAAQNTNSSSFKNSEKKNWKGS